MVHYSDPLKKECKLWTKSQNLASNAVNPDLTMGFHEWTELEVQLELWSAVRRL